MPALKTDAVNVNDPDVVKALLRVSAISSPNQCTTAN